jgi:hypothetical protein
VLDYGQKVDSKCQADYPAITINDISGRILAYNATVTFKPFKNLSFAAGVTCLKCRVDADKEKLNGYLKWGL